MFYFSGNDNRKYSLESTEEGFWTVHRDDEAEVHSYKSLSGALRYLISRVAVSDQGILEELIKSGDGVADLLFLEVPEVLSLLGKSTKSRGNLKRDHKAIYEKSTKIGNRSIMSIQNVRRLIHGN